MNGRERLLAWANGELPNDTFKQAVLTADRAASDDVDGDDEHVAFVKALIVQLGLKRPAKRPRKISMAFDMNLSRLRRMAAEDGVSHGEIARAVVTFGIASETAIRDRLRRFAKVAAILDSDEADEGRKLLLASIDRRNG